MKRCPAPGCTLEHGDSVRFCRVHGTALVTDDLGEDAGTLRLGSATADFETETRILPAGGGRADLTRLTGNDLPA